MNEKNESRSARFMAAARLIRGVSSGRQPEGIYEDGIYSYVILADALENDGLARNLSQTAGVPYGKIRPSAKKIIEVLLWNRQDNPFTSLGLSPFATVDEIHRRWKRLIAIYHPDRHMDDPGSEEAAKKINEAYKRAVQIKSLPQRKLVPFPAGPAASARTRAENRTARPQKKRFAPAPAMVLLASALLAIFFVLIFLGDRHKTRPFDPQGKPGGRGIIVFYPEGIKGRR